MGSESVKTAGDSGQACDLTDVSVEELRGSSSQGLLEARKKSDEQGVLQSSELQIIRNTSYWFCLTLCKEAGREREEEFLKSDHTTRSVPGTAIELTNSLGHSFETYHSMCGYPKS